MADVHRQAQSAVPLGVAIPMHSVRLLAHQAERDSEVGVRGASPVGCNEVAGRDDVDGQHAHGAHVLRAAIRHEHVIPHEFHLPHGIGVLRDAGRTLVAALQHVDERLRLLLQAVLDREVDEAYEVDSTAVLRVETPGLAPVLAPILTVLKPVYAHQHRVVHDLEARQQHRVQLMHSTKFSAHSLRDHESALSALEPVLVLAN
mmetsp:Transcript_70953/g.164025  ORF Transcript_70953/g.164025 Transcript_70953/m.164025 type:complete len:203 (-) Transcript_70953:1882-2490(-)